MTASSLAIDPNTVLDGKAVSQKLLDDLKTEIASCPSQPGLAVLRVGEDPASVVYVNKKAKTAKELGLHSEIHVLPETASQQEVLDRLHQLNTDPAIHAILVQLPLPKQICTDTILNAIAPHKDADGFHPQNLGILLAGQMPVAPPCTPAGMMEILKAYNIELTGKHAVVIGRSTIVGKPVGLMLLQQNATVTFCHSRTQNLAEVVKQADIIVAAVGKPGLVTAEMVKPGAVILDVGINRVDGKLVGDVDYANVAPIAGKITPVPGGVGPMTIAMLMKNTVSLYQAAQQ